MSGRTQDDESPFLLEALQPREPVGEGVPAVVAQFATIARRLSRGARPHLERALVRQLVDGGVRGRPDLAAAVASLRRAIGEQRAGEAEALEAVEAEASEAEASFEESSEESSEESTYEAEGADEADFEGDFESESENESEDESEDEFEEAAAEEAGETDELGEEESEDESAEYEASRYEETIATEWESERPAEGNTEAPFVEREEEEVQGPPIDVANIKRLAVGERGEEEVESESVEQEEEAPGTTAATVPFLLAGPIVRRPDPWVVSSPLGEAETSDYDELPPEKLVPFQIRGGLYSPDLRKTELAGDGIILTASKTGKEEGKLAARSPLTIKITKEIAQLEGGRFNRWIQKYNAFTIHFAEVLRQIGRLRDLLSVGAPEEPKAMSARQKASVYREPGTQTDRDKKEAYRQWRVAPDSAQRNYLLTIKALAGAYGEVDRQRGIYWEALHDFEKTIMEAKRLKKPVFEDAFPSLADLVGILTAGSVKGGVASLAAIGVDWLLEVRKMRRDYDEKLKRFLDDFKMIKEAKAYDLMKIQRAGDDYWQSFSDRAEAAHKLKAFRSETRQRAALFGEALGSNKLPDTVKAQLRMPPLVADAWNALAVSGARARNRFDAIMKEKPFLQWAMTRYKKRRDFGHEDIDEVFIAFRRAFSWSEVLTTDAVAHWKAKDALWEEMWTKFNV